MSAATIFLPLISTFICSENLSAVKSLLVIDFVSRVHCQESGEESSESESVYSLKCHVSPDVNHLREGLKHGLKSQVERRNAIYFKESRINGLPRYLTIEFVRFFLNNKSNQKVDYPLELDVYDFCSSELCKKLEELSKGSEESSTVLYDLVAVLTHKGRSADSGHYIAWVKQENGKWIEYDDDSPLVPLLLCEEDITSLSVGGYWDMAYICMYKERK